MTILLMALAGFSIGGVIATIQQKRPAWVPVLFAVLAAMLLWAGLVTMSSSGASV